LNHKKKDEKKKRRENPTTTPSKQIKIHNRFSEQQKQFNLHSTI
jgi:hypothetical protein